MEDLRVSNDILRKNIDKDNRLMAGFQNTFRNAIKNENNLLVLRVKMAKELQALSAWENNQQMMDIYKNVSQGFMAISAAHQTYVSKSILLLPRLITLFKKD